MFANALGQSRATSGFSQRCSACHIISYDCSFCRFSSVSYVSRANIQRSVARRRHPSECCPAASLHGDIPSTGQTSDSFPKRGLHAAAASNKRRTGPPSQPPRHPTPLASDPGNALLRPPITPPQSPPLPPGWSQPPLEARALLSAILNCGDLDTLLQLLRKHDHSLNVRHLDAALNRLGRLSAAVEDGQGRGGGGDNRHQRHGSGGGSGATEAAAAAAARAAAARLLSSVLPAATESLTPRDCASVLSALARLELPPPPPAAALLQGRLLAQLWRASVRDVAQALHASAKLRLALPDGAVSELLRRLDGELAAVGKAQDVSMVLWSLATLELSPPPLEWITRLLAQAPPPRPDVWQPQALANSAWALARLGCRPGPGWLGALVEASGRLMESFSTPELVNLMWALAVMRHSPPRAWAARALGLLRDRAASLTPQDISNLSWSLAVMRLRPGLPLLHRLVARALALRRQLGPQALVTTLWGLSRLGVQVPERAVALLLQGGLGAAALYGTPAGVAAAGAAAATGGVRLRRAADQPAAAAAVGPGDLAGAALVLSYCRHVPPRRWLVRYCSAVSRQLHLFGPRELSTLLYGIGRLGRMGLRPDPHWLDRVLTEVERLAAPPPPPLPIGGDRGNPTGGGTPVDGGPTAAATGGLATASGDGAQALAAGVALPSGSAPPPPEAPLSSQPSQQQQQQRRQHAAGQWREAIQRPRLDPAQLAVVLWAVARLGHRPPEAWVAAMARRVAERAEEFGSRDAAATIRALQELAAAAATRRTPAVPAARGSYGGGSSTGRSDTSRNRSSLGRRGRRGISGRSGIASSSSSSSTPGSGSSSTSGSSGCCGEAVAALVARLASSLPERSLYGALRSASLSRGGMSYATVADQLLTDVYSVKSLGLLQGGHGRAVDGDGSAAGGGCGGASGVAESGGDGGAGGGAALGLTGARL